MAFEIKKKKKLHWTPKANEEKCSNVNLLQRHRTRNASSYSYHITSFDWFLQSMLLFTLHTFAIDEDGRIALMHVVIVMSCELARESLMGVRPCQGKVQSACWHCCCQVCSFSVFSKMPYLMRFSLQFDSTNTTKLQDLDVWFFFSFPQE